MACALDKTDLLLKIPPNLPPSLYALVSRQAIFDVGTGSIRFIPRVNNLTKAALISKLTAYDSQWANKTNPFMITMLLAPKDNQLLCDCKYLLGDDEFFVSEIPIKQVDGRYLSLNDESYKAIMELINYPLDSAELVSVAFSELAYVYNADAIKIFLQQRGFELIFSRGLMNSPDYPGYRDTQFMLVRQVVGKQIYVVIRGTSGALDVNTSLDGGLIHFGGQGKVHSGYADIAKYIYKEITPFLSLGGEDWILTGHSLGGSVAILLSELISKAHISSITITYAPAPLVDFDHYKYQQGLDSSILNYFLPNEELNIDQGKNKWLYLPGKKVELGYVGTTAGAAHFVINYLKSRLVESELSRAQYEESLPHCVFIKYPCFDNGNVAFLPACIFFSDACLSKNIELFLGFNLSFDQFKKMIRAPHLPENKQSLPANIQALMLDRKYALLRSKKNLFDQDIIFAQLMLLNALVGDDMAASRAFDVIKERYIKTGYSQGVIGLGHSL